LTRTALTGVLIFVFCALIRISLVDRHGLWADEFFSLAMATGHSLEHPADRADPAFGDYVEASTALPPDAYSRYLEHGVPPCGPGRVVRAVLLSDTNPPLYYLLLYGWTRALGTGDAVLRLFSVLCSLACFPILWSLAKRLGGLGAAVSTCILFAVSPLSVFYSTEGRMYSLLMLSTVCTMWLTLKLRDEGPSALTFALWVAAGVAGLVTHYFFLFVWSAAVFWLLSHPGRFPRRLSGAGALMAVLLILPWYLHLPASLAQWRVTGHWLTIRPSGYHPIMTALSLPWSFLSINGVWGGSRRLGVVNAGVFALLAVAALRKLSRSILSTPRSLLWLWLFSPCFGMVAFDLVRGTYVTAVPRYAFAGMPAAFLLVGLGLGSLGSRLRGIFIWLIVLLCLISVRMFYRGDGRSGQNYPEVARLLSHQVGKSDLILVHSIPSCVAGIARYLERNDASKTGVGFASWVGQLGRRRVPEDIEAFAAGRRRIILITTHEVYERAPEKSWLEENTMLVEMRQIHWSTVFYFRPRGSATFFEQKDRELDTGPQVGRQGRTALGQGRSE
jgi:hypothetical protein